MKLLPGPSAWAWQCAYLIGAWWFFLGLVAVGVSSIGLHVGFDTHPPIAGIIYGLFVVGFVVFLVSPLVQDVRDGLENKAGYTTLPYGRRPYALVDRHTGAVIRPAGIAPLGKRVHALSLKAERQRAASRAEVEGPGEAVQLPGAVPGWDAVPNVRSIREWKQLVAHVRSLMPDSLVLAGQRNSEFAATLNLAYGIDQVPPKFVWSITADAATLWSGTGTGTTRRLLVIGKNAVEELHCAAMSWSNGATYVGVEFVIDHGGIRRRIPFAVRSLDSPLGLFLLRTDAVANTLAQIDELWHSPAPASAS